MPRTSDTTREAHPTGEEIAALAPEALQKLRSLRRPGRPNIVVRVVSSYLTDLPGLITQLRETEAGGDLEAVKFLAHTLKSGSANVGGMALSRLCEELEQGTSEPGAGSIADLVRRIDDESQRVRVALEEELRKETQGTVPE